MFYFCFIHFIVYQSILIYMFFSQAYVIFLFTMFFCTSLSGLACFGWSDVELLQGMFWCKVWVVLRCCKYIHQVHSPPTTQISSKFVHTLRLSRRSQIPVLRWFGQVVELLLNKHMFNSAFLMAWVTVTSTSILIHPVLSTQFVPNFAYTNILYRLTSILTSRVDISVFVVLLNKHMFYSAFLMVWVSTSNLIHLDPTTQIASNFVHIFI